MAYTTINKPTDYFNTKLYTGNGTDNHAITGVGFQPDFIWVKARSSAKEHRLQNAVSGITNHMRSNATNAESAGSVKTADSDGFTLGTGASWNENSTTYASWNWLANGAGVANTDGSITSTVSANTTSGFSIITYTGNGTSGATIGHGLGAVPKMIITKRTDTTNGWGVYHHTLGTGKELYLNYTNSEGSSNFWITTPTTSVFSASNSDYVNFNTGNYVAYCFAEKKGYSKFGSYRGNASTDGTFIYTGFKPAFVMTKCTSSSGNWKISWSVDHLNGTGRNLAPNLVDSENTANKIDLLSNGFKLRASDTDRNLSGGTFIYMAIAEAPLVGTNNIPCTAR